MRRLLRVIEYTGTDTFIADAIRRRSVKGTMVLTFTDSIREAIIGETDEILSLGVAPEASVATNNKGE